MPSFYVAQPFVTLVLAGVFFLPVSWRYGDAYTHTGRRHSCPFRRVLQSLFISVRRPVNRTLHAYSGSLPFSPACRRSQKGPLLSLADDSARVSSARILSRQTTSVCIRAPMRSQFPTMEGTTLHLIFVGSPVTLWYESVIQLPVAAPLHFSRLCVRALPRVYLPVPRWDEPIVVYGRCICASAVGENRCRLVLAESIPS